MDQLIPYISEVGFPIVVTMYLLHQIESKLKAVIASIRLLPQEMKNQ
jgi:hypothetical protein